MSGNSNRVWLEADGLGGFASGTVAGIRTRRYHALLLTATPMQVHPVELWDLIDRWDCLRNGNSTIMFS